MSEGAATTVLVIDDESALRRCLKRVLEREGFSVLDAATGAEGVRVLQANPVHVVLLDRSMPGITGPALVPQLRAVNARVPILFHTGGELTDEERRLVQGVVSKPATPAELRRALRGTMGW